MSQQSSLLSFVIVVSGASGAGKTILVRKVADILGDAVALHFDDYQFVAGREPKFELVYDVRASQPVLQFSVATDFTRAEVEALFPEPYGVAFPDLGDIFRTVYLAHPWPNLIIRFDLNYRSEGVVSDWDMGEWLVTQGSRIR